VTGRREWLLTDESGTSLPLTEAGLRSTLKEWGLTSPAAATMSIDEVIHQVNNVNGGEVTVTENNPYTKTRVCQPPAHAGRWVVQGWFPNVQVWGDLGDPVDTHAEALAKEREWENKR
jgi:hypothetical protein